MRVVFLNPTGMVGGAERVLVNLIRSLRDIEPALRLALIAGVDGPLLDEARRAGAECQVLEIPPEIRSFGRAVARASRGGYAEAAWRSARAGVAAIAYATRLRRALARLQPDVVHSNGIKFHLLSGLNYASEIPTVWHMHDFLSRRPVVGRVLRALHRKTISAVAVSSAVQRDCAKLLPSTQLTTVYNALDTEHFSPDTGKVAALDALTGEAGDRRSACRVGLVATYARWKGQDVFLRAAASILRAHAGLRIHFYIVGGPIYETEGSQFSVPELEGLARELGIRDSVSFIPYQADTAPVYRALDVVVHASTEPEPFGMTIAESMACGRATVVSNGGGASELYQSGEAVAADPGDLDSLAGSIVALVRDPQLRERVGRSARAAAVKRFPLERLGRQMLELYRSATGRPTTGRSGPRA